MGPFAPAMELWEPFLGALLLVCMVTDLARGLIYNWVTLPAVLLGLGLGFHQAGWPGLGASALGMAVGGGIFLIPFVLNAVGGGDVKLMAGVGALAGAPFALKTALYACIAGGVWALFAMAVKGKLGRGLGDTGRFFKGLLLPGLKAEKPSPLGLRPLPFGLCIALGAAWGRYWDFLPPIWGG